MNATVKQYIFSQWVTERYGSVVLASDHKAAAIKANELSEMGRRVKIVRAISWAEAYRVAQLHGFALSLDVTR